MSSYINRSKNALESDIENVTLDIHKLEEAISDLVDIRAGLRNALAALNSAQMPLLPEVAEPEVKLCGRIMVGSGSDTYDPTCELPEGHDGTCKSTSAIDQNKLEVTPAPKNKTKGPLKVSEVRDAVLTFDSEFTQTDLAGKLGRSATTVHPKLGELIRSGIVVKCERTVRNSVNGKESFLYKYNSELPPGPTERPKEPTPENLAVGASLSNGTAATNGRVRVSNKTIQGFIDVALSQGWEVTHKTGNHYKFKSPDGRTVGVNAKPPSMQVCDVIKRDLKRSGLRIA